ncbi:MAG: hypothetical protein RMJ19_13805 [Gemmatales bacterium]|nr:hypothetical protein [Gemmatales bacterium]MDW8176746.1 hypothetical protein [Gemmatales bacterium]
MRLPGHLARTILVWYAVLWSASLSVRADVFDRYTNLVLSQAVQNGDLTAVQTISAAQLSEAPRLVPNSQGALVVVRTQNGLLAKLLVQVGRQKLGEQVLPVVVVERFVTYRPGTERSVAAEGRNLHLYPDFVLNLEIGQIVPATAVGDLRFSITAEKQEVLESAGKARLFLVAKPLPGTEGKKSARPAPDDNYRLEFFNGTFRLYDDGRRSGILRLQVDAEGNLSGEFLSDATGNKYPVTGKVAANPRHAVQFSIKFPQSVQHFSGYMFTRGGQAICGSSRFQEREAGFYAVRTEED